VERREPLRWTSEQARAGLIRASVEPLTEIEGEDSRWAYFRDPEGNGFEITQRTSPG
jgi:catechol-2,3-dioxygenase